MSEHPARFLVASLSLSLSRKLILLCVTIDQITRAITSEFHSRLLYDLKDAGKLERGWILSHLMWILACIQRMGSSSLCMLTMRFSYLLIHHLLPPSSSDDDKKSMNPNDFYKNPTTVGRLRRQDQRELYRYMYSTCTVILWPYWTKSIHHSFEVRGWLSFGIFSKIQDNSNLPNHNNVVEANSPSERLVARTLLAVQTKPCHLLPTLLVHQNVTGKGECVRND